MLYYYITISTNKKSTVCVRKFKLHIFAHYKVFTQRYAMARFWETVCLEGEGEKQSPMYLSLIVQSGLRSLPGLEGEDYQLGYPLDYQAESLRLTLTASGFLFIYL